MTSKVIENYKKANLIPLLEAIRTPRRYEKLEKPNGINILTNAALDETYSKEETIRELHNAIDAGKKGNHTFAPEFTNTRQGLSLGLNPYTDWAIAQLNSRPTHYYLFLGIDWYSISALGDPNYWFEYIGNPFANARDRYWHNLWAWIMRKFKKSANGVLSWRTPILEQDASEFILKDGGGFIFHNRIPYLRPAGYENAGTNWYETEWKKKSVSKDAIEDLRLLRSLAGNRIMAFCTSNESVSALAEAGYDRRNIVSWGAHPSRVFHPSGFIKENLWFQGQNHFQT